MRTATWSLLCVFLWPAIVAAGLVTTQEEGRLVVTGDHFRLTIATAQGGELVGLELFDGSGWNRVLGGPSASFPALCLRQGGREYRLKDATSSGFEQLEIQPDVVRFRSTATPRAADGTAGPWRITLGYEIYAEGAVFVDVECLAEDTAAAVEGLSVGLTVDRSLVEAAKYRQEVFRGKTPAFPSARVAFGVHPTKSFTNELQVLVEDNRPWVGQTGFEATKDCFTWSLADGSGAREMPKSYRNRLALALGAAATGKPRSNLIGQRVYHWINYLDREATAAWFPTDEQIDRMAAHGATMLVLHQDWMLQSGRNGKPHADYTTAREEAGLRRTIERAHEHKMRVGLYRRAIEGYSLKTPLIGDWLRRDWDGFYVDWNSPHAIAQHEHDYPAEAALGDVHSSSDGNCLPARDYFLFCRGLRAAVGPEGFLIGHQGFGNAGVLPNLVFDAYLPGEVPSDHRMFSDRDNAVYRGMLASGPCMPWPLDAPAFSSPEGVAKMAAWGFYPHVGLGLDRKADRTRFPLDPDDPVNGFADPYWRLLAAVDMEQARAFNLPSDSRVAAECADPNFACLVYQSRRGQETEYLAIVANLASQPGQTAITLQPDVLGLHGSYQLERIDATSGTATALGTTTGSLSTSLLPAWGLEGFRLRQP